MAIEKGLVVTAIETKYKGKGLSKTFINGTATKIAEQLEADTEIEGKLTELDFMFTTAIAEADRRVTEAVKKATTTKAPEGGKGKKEADDEDQPAEDDPDMPKWMKPLMSQITELNGKVSKMEQEKTANTISDRFHNDPRLKGLDKKILKGYIPKTEEELEDAIESAAEELKEFVKTDDDVHQQQQQGVKARAFGGDKPNKGGKSAGGGAGKVTEATKEELDAVAAKLNL